MQAEYQGLKLKRGFPFDKWGRGEECLDDLGQQMKRPLLESAKSEGKYAVTMVFPPRPPMWNSGGEMCENSTRLPTRTAPPDEVKGRLMKVFEEQWSLYKRQECSFNGQERVSECPEHPKLRYPY
eukprot:TRINITY_DN4921_c0_g1_i1.p1 TRINITY_DN4921_c0_g1~~TRINITY_DN4921_c0_g1_i1.p1  ORF type:complete len:125 (+),score=6.61 TRINITY_DN4921_c0_g1_i1:579-953(+)